MSDLNPAFVSILMPVRNEERWIARSLSAVLSQDYPHKCLEIIVADGLSQDSTVTIVQRLAAEDDRVRLVSNIDRTQAAGMNQMLRLARGDIILRVDGHTEIASDYVRRCVEALDTSQAACVGGALNAVGRTPVSHAIATASKSPFFVPTTFRISSVAADTDTVYLGAWRRRVFEEVGNFDEALAVNEDYEFNYRLRQSGGHIYFTPTICSRYHSRDTLGALARQNFRYGLWKPMVLVKHPASFRIRHAAAPAFVALIILGCLLPSAAPLQQAGIAAYALLNGVFTLRCRQGIPPDVLLRISVIFLTVHLAWGCGFWFGVFRVIAKYLSKNLP